MEFKIDKLSFHFMIAIVALGNNIPISAMTGDTEQPIHIESDMQSLDMEGNVVTFTGSVTITQGTIRINASKVVVTSPGGERGKEIIDGYGNPATFFQIQDNGRSVKGRASHMNYRLDKKLLILTGNAYLEEMDSNISSDKITYLVKEKKMHAYSEKGKRVVTVLASPSYPQKTNEGQSSGQKRTANLLCRP